MQPCLSKNMFFINKQFKCGNVEKQGSGWDMGVASSRSLSRKAGRLAMTMLIDVHFFCPSKRTEEREA
jgi:hypothetical protein